MSRGTKLQSFEFKVLYRLIPCNKYLHTIKIKDSPDCTMCGETDCISHFFYTCPTVKAFWHQLSQWCERHLDLSLSHLSTPEIIYGLTEQSWKAKIVNWFLLTAKFYIQKQRLFHDAKLSLIAFLAESRSRLLTERTVCYLENRPKKLRTWQRLLNVLG